MSTEQAHLWTSRPAMARRSDPPSSHRAAERAVKQGTVRGHEAKIVEALRRSGEPMTAKALAVKCKLTNVQICRRLGEQGKLLKLHLVRLSTDCPLTGEQRFVLGRAA